MRPAPQAQALYAKMVAAARQPDFFARWSLPDTMTGRFDSLVLHVFLFTHRIRDRDEVRDFGQEVFDIFFGDLDASLREVGIGDLTVPKRLKKMANSFYGQVQVYSEPLQAENVEALSEALERNLAADGKAVDTRAIAEYMIAAQAHLAQISDDAILRGEISYPDAADIAVES